MNRKKYLYIIRSGLLWGGAVILLCFFVFRFSVSARTLRDFESGKEQTMNLYEIPTEYQFSAQIQKDTQGERITEFVPFGVWDNAQKDYAPIQGDFVITRITGEGGKGTLGAWYYNVGTYQGKVVDLKCTIVDYMQKAGPNDTSGANLGWVAMSAEQLGIYIRHLQWVEIEMEYYDALSGTPLTIQSTAVLTDIDEGEGIMILSECDSLQETENCRLQTVNWQAEDKIFYETEEKSANDEAKDSWAQIQVLFTGTKFRYRTYSKLGMDLVLEKEATKKLLSEGVNGPEAPEFMFHFQGYSDCRLAPLRTGDGVLTAEDSDETGKETCTLYHREEDFVYEMTYAVSPEYKNWYYDSFIVCAQLPKEVEYFSGEVYTQEGMRVSERFFIRESEGQVFFEAKNLKEADFYGKIYEFAIHGNIKKDVDIEGLWNDTSYVVPLSMQVKIERNDKIEEKQTNQAQINISSEYVEGTVNVVLKDCLSGASLTDGEVVLYEWDEDQKDYEEVKKAIYDKNIRVYKFQELTKNHKNQGKYKVSVSQIPEHYLGDWEQEFQVNKNKAVFEITGTHQPTGQTLIRITSKIIRTAQGKEHVLEEHDGSEQVVYVQPGDKIQYHIYVERDSALSYKSGELLIKNKIPQGLLYEKATLNLIGEIQNPVENSTAKIASVLLSKDRELTWKINHLDEGEIAHVLYEVMVPKEIAKQEAVAYVVCADLIDGTLVTKSNVLEHQVEGLKDQSAKDDTTPVITPEEVSAVDKKGKPIKELSKEIHSSKSGAVKTGDETNIGVYVGLLMAAVLAAGVIFIIKRKRNSSIS